MENKTRKREKSMEQQMAEPTAINCWANLNELHIEAKKWESDSTSQQWRSYMDFWRKHLQKSLLCEREGLKYAKLSLNI